jgi:hypothetical protein
MLDTLHTKLPHIIQDRSDVSHLKVGGTSIEHLEAFLSDAPVDG